MVNEKLLKKYSKIYDKINKIYKDKKNLYESCNKIGISHTTYYRICKVLKKEGIVLNKEHIKKESLKGGNIEEIIDLEIHGVNEPKVADVLPNIPKIKTDINNDKGKKNMSTKGIDTNEQNTGIKKRFRQIKEKYRNVE